MTRLFLTQMVPMASSSSLVKTLPRGFCLQGEVRRKEDTTMNRQVDHTGCSRSAIVRMCHGFAIGNTMTDKHLSLR